MAFGSLYIEAQGYVHVLLENLCGMQCLLLMKTSTVKLVSLKVLFIFVTIYDLKSYFEMYDLWLLGFHPELHLKPSVENRSQ